MNAIENTQAAAAPKAGSSILSTGGAKFADNPFLQLLVTQMKSQTPLEPVDNAAFMEQMASFSSMEQQKELNDNMLKLLDFQGTLARLQGLSEASNLLGKEVEFDRGADGKGKGIAESVFVDESGDVRLLVGGEEISLRHVVGVSEPGADAEA